MRCFNRPSIFFPSQGLLKHILEGFQTFMGTVCLLAALKPEGHRFKHLVFHSAALYIQNLFKMKTAYSQCLLLPHRISPSVSLSHPLVGKNRPLISLLILRSHWSDTWGKGFRAAQVHSKRKITGSIGKWEKDDTAELCNSSVPTAAS